MCSCGAIPATNRADGEHGLIPAPLPDNEDGRLDMPGFCKILDTASEETSTRLTRLVGELLEVDISEAPLVDRRRQRLVWRQPSKLRCPSAATRVRSVGFDVFPLPSGGAGHRKRAGPGSGAAW